MDGGGSPPVIGTGVVFAGMHVTVLQATTKLAADLLALVMYLFG